jgi:hypothetical protein
MAQVMGEVRALPKGDEFKGGPGGSYRFRGVDSTINAVGPVLRKYHVVGPVPHLDDVRYETIPVGNSQHPTGFARVVVTYRFIGPRGDELSCTVPGEAMDRGDKAIAKAMSVAMRIALLQSLCLPTEDTDPDADNYERSQVAVREESRRGPSTPMLAQAAREALLEKIKRLGLDPREVAKLYLVDTERDIATDTDYQAIRSFTERLAPAE